MRLAMKTTSYGFVHIGVATTVAYSLTGNLMAAIGIGLIEPVIQTGVFAAHEYLWERKKGQGKGGSSQNKISKEVETVLSSYPSPSPAIG